MVISQWSCFLYIPDADRLSYTIPFPETNIVSWKSTPAKGDSYWKPSFFWGGYVSFREGIQSDLSRMSTHPPFLLLQGWTCILCLEQTRLIFFQRNGRLTERGMMVVWTATSWWVWTWCTSRCGSEFSCCWRWLLLFNAFRHKHMYQKEGMYAIFTIFTNICFIILVYVDIYIYTYIYYVYIYKCTPCIHPMGFRLNQFELDTHFKAHFTL